MMLFTHADSRPDESFCGRRRRTDKIGSAPAPRSGVFHLCRPRINGVYSRERAFLASKKQQLGGIKLSPTRLLLRSCFAWTEKCSGSARACSPWRHQASLCCLFRPANPGILPRHRNILKVAAVWRGKSPRNGAGRGGPAAESRRCLQSARRNSVHGSKRGSERLYWPWPL